MRRLTASWARDPRDILFVAVWVVIMALILFSFGALVRLPTSKIPACQKSAAPHVAPPLIILACLVCIFLGSFIRRRWRAPSARGAPSQPTGVAIFGFALLPVLSSLAIALLAYETWAVAGTVSWPITHYIRCAYAVAPNWTAVGACSVSFVFGHWFL